MRHCPPKTMFRIRSDFTALVRIHTDIGYDPDYAYQAAIMVMWREFGIDMTRYLNR